MLKRFLAYYKPHKKLFILDMSVAFMASLLSIFFPYTTRLLLKTALPEKNAPLIFTLLAVILGIYILTAFLSYVRITWGHIMGALFFRPLNV